MKDSGLSTHELAKIADVTQPVICRFLNGTRGINLTTAAKLAEAMGLELKPTKRQKKVNK